MSSLTIRLVWLAFMMLLVGCSGDSGGSESGGQSIPTPTPTPTPTQDQMAIPSSDANIRYTGRWDFTDPLAPWVGWQGASIIATFNGTGIIAHIDPGTSTEWFRVIIDDDHFGSVRVSVSPGINDLILATDLINGQHTVELVKETYQGSNTTFHGFTVNSPDLKGLVANVPEPSRRIVFYGDSNLAGDSLGHEHNNSAWEYSGSHFTFAGITSRMLGAAYHNISTSGETINGARNRHDRIDYWDASSLYDFTFFPADLVVVNLGANNVGQGEQQIRTRYEDLLNTLRIAHPDAHIVLFNGYGWDYDEPANYTSDVVANYGDPNISAAVFPWVFEQWHGCEYDHAGMAAVLVKHVAQVLGWSANDNDVMSGFGIDGDVANGSFEDVAPFGGFGWRYADGLGVQRVQEASGAADGDYYVQLSDNAEIHQPNPAFDGDVVTVTVWLKAEINGETARLMIDFRDQKMWTNPLASTSVDAVLTTSWQPYVIQATAPIAGSMPVFNTRLTVTASTGATVSVDQIEMITDSL
jgi:hypothetical protein